MRVFAKAPCRVDLAGATLDIWPLYLFHDNVVTVNFAVDLYTSCEISTRDDSRIILRSKDLGKEETFRIVRRTVHSKSAIACLFSPCSPDSLLPKRGSRWNRPRKLPPTPAFRVRPR